MNLSETAFVECYDTSSQTQINDTLHTFQASQRFKLRWFTPTTEVPLCGHATMAAAYAIFHENNPAERLYFDTLSGELSVAIHKPTPSSGVKESSLSMDLPLLLPTSQPHDMPCKDFLDRNSMLITSATKNTGRQIDEILYEPSLKYLVIVLNGTMEYKELERVDIDVFGMHKAHTEGHLVGVILTVQSSSGGTGGNGGNSNQQYDFLSRFFGPWAGIAEDPVTGSAHSVLGALWRDRLEKSCLFARQCSKRGGELKVDVVEKERVVITGDAFVVMKGVLFIE